MKIIKNYNQFDKIAKNQNRDIILYSAKEINNEIEKITSEYTIFSIQDDNDGESAYIVKGYRIVNNIGYYLLEGEYELLNGYIDL